MPLVAAVLSGPARPEALGVGLALLLGGELIRWLAAATIGRVSRTRSAAVGPLVTTGLYRVVRNPLYVGNLLIYAGVGALRWPWGLLLVPLGALYYAAIVAWEEERLTATHGAAYAAWQRAVPRWWPRWRALAGLQRGELQLGAGLRSERGTLAVLVGAGAYLAWRTMG